MHQVLREIIHICEEHYILFKFPYNSPNLVYYTSMYCLPEVIPLTLIALYYDYVALVELLLLFTGYYFNGNVYCSYWKYLPCTIYDNVSLKENACLTLTLQVQKCS